MALNLPAELTLQVCVHALSNGNFSSLLLVNRALASCVNTHAEFLLVQLIKQHDLSPSVLSLYEHAQAMRTSHESVLRPRSLLLLNLHRDIAAAASISDSLTERYRAGLHFTYTNLPRPLPGSIEALLIVSCISRMLGAHETLDVPQTTGANVLTAGKTTGILENKEIPAGITRFIKEHVPLHEFESVIPTLELCAENLMEAGIRPNLSQSSGAEGTIEHWQNRVLRKGVMNEMLCWKGVHWYRGMLETASIYKGPATCAAELQARNVWEGSHGDAARLAANGVMQLLRTQRMSRYADRVNDRSQDVQPYASQHFWATYVGTWHHSSGDL